MRTFFTCMHSFDEGDACISVDGEILDVASEICLVSPHGSIKSDKESGVAFSAVPEDIEVCERRFVRDAQYFKAVNYMYKICADSVLETAYNTNAKYRAAITVVTNHPNHAQPINMIALETKCKRRANTKEELNQMLAEMANSIAEMTNKVESVA